jgi:hypothetical protein
MRDVSGALYKQIYLKIGRADRAYREAGRREESASSILYIYHLRQLPPGNAQAFSESGY